MLVTALLVGMLLLGRLDLYTEARGPGLAYVVVQGGEVRETRAVGYADRKTMAPITAATRFNLASNSKQFTAAALYLLEKDGKLSRKDLVRTYVPELPDYARDVRLEHLDFHTSGMPDYMGVCDGRRPITNKEVLEALARETSLAFPAGSRFEYSNSGYVLLAEVIQRVSGQPFPEHLQARIFGPLGMTDAAVISLGAPSDHDRGAVGYGPWPFLDREDKDPCDYIYGDGGIVMSVVDYAKWARALSRPGFFSATDLATLFTSGTQTDGESVAYGWGWGLESWEGRRLVTHGGSWRGFRSSTAYLPDDDVFVAMFSNYAGLPRWELLDELLTVSALPLLGASAVVRNDAPCDRRGAEEPMAPKESSRHSMLVSDAGSGNLDNCFSASAVRTLRASSRGTRGR